MLPKNLILITSSAMNSEVKNKSGDFEVSSLSKLETDHDAQAPVLESPDGTPSPSQGS